MSLGSLRSTKIGVPVAAVGRTVGVGVGSSSVMVNVALPGASVAVPETTRQAQVHRAVGLARRGVVDDGDVETLRRLRRAAERQLAGGRGVVLAGDGRARQGQVFDDNRFRRPRGPG